MEGASPWSTLHVRHGIYAGLVAASAQRRAVQQRVRAGANGKVLQLAQGWSFRVTHLDRVITQVKAWGFALERLRSGDEARLVDAQGRLSSIAKDVDLQIVVATPETSEQQAAYEEAEQVFRTLKASVHPVEAVTAVSARAADLVRTIR
ncbi:hypothetical protein Mth01_38050 [Sphaerimonospora thailandensis]|uniref:Uncharacterized protein n=1 Tax=Sphaerimonospora thailandensis TaxID=795644 RepID=A0A8J3W0F5_9ACTN|nr:hypothetical protein Mth01_38050 [Sphaerimonospora thailandensis]